MTRDVVADEVVAAFIEAVPVVRAEVFNGLPVQCSTALDLVRAVNAGLLSPTWQTPMGARYEKHGLGVRLTSADGRVIELDANEADDMFDAWRVDEFARSIGRMGLTIESLQASLARHADRGVLRRANSCRMFSRVAQPHTDTRP